MKKIIVQNKINILALLLSLLQVGVSFINDKYIFLSQSNLMTIPYQNWMYVCKIIVFILMFILWKTILNKKVKNFKFIALYFIIMLVFFVLVYPGVWRWDDIINLGSLTDGRLYYWQHYLSGLYFYFCMCFVPTASGIVLIQITIISMIVGHIIGNEYRRIGKKALFLYILFLLPSIIDSNFYPIRANICAYMELYLFYELLKFNSNDKKNQNKKLIYLIVITALLSVWRPENFVYIFIILILYVFIYKISIKKVAVIFIIGLSMMVLLTNIQSQGLDKATWTSSTGNIMSEKELYTLSGFISPLENLVRIAIDRNEFKDELKEIDKMISVESLCTKGALGTFWGGGLKSLTPNQLKQLEKIYIKMSLKYLPEFISQRYYLFLSSNGYIEDAQLFLHGSAHIYDRDNIVEIPADIKKVYNEFEVRYIANKPLNPNLRRQVISTLEMKKVTDLSTGNKMLSMIFYNCTLAVIITCIVWGIALFKKEWSLALMIAALAAKFSIIVATAPMSAYMYYFSTHLICSFISVCAIIQLMSKIKIKK